MSKSGAAARMARQGILCGRSRRMSASPGAMLGPSAGHPPAAFGTMGGAPHPQSSSSRFCGARDTGSRFGTTERTKCWFDRSTHPLERLGLRSTRTTATSSATAASTSTEGCGYQSIGSFHSDDIEVLRSQPTEDYIAPTVPFSLEQTDAWASVARLAKNTAAAPVFGKALKKQFFLLDQDWIFVNHGAFGGVLRPGFEAGVEWQAYSETQPLRFFDRVLLPHLTHSLRIMAQFVNAAPSNMVLVQNATAGMNAILQHEQQRLQPGDRVFMLETAYGSVKKLAEEVCARSGAILDIGALPLPLPDTKDDAVRALVDAVSSQIKADTKLVILDETTSNTAINMPISLLAAAARAASASANTTPTGDGISSDVGGARSSSSRIVDGSGCSADCKVIVDGAHGLLAQPLDLTTCGADYYVSNCHKWFSSPKGAAILWAKDPTTLAPLTISHGYGEGAWSGFAWDGCRDYSAALSLPTVAKFWDALGVDASRQYMKSTLHRAVSILECAWGGDGENGGGATVRGGDLIAPIELHGPMALVALPQDWLGKPEGEATSADAKMVQDSLHHEHTVECPVKCIEGRLYVRISAHVYNEASDYEALADAVLAIIRKYRAEQKKKGGGLNSNFPR